ncbi:1,2-phenylacetyl-CoA epoxidase subunit PaaD [Lysinibacillus endophyticus]|uniref:1,2-phenylacetyl-CoA epoxidase subunit PaaD n=1 Tax=Ureibacillus endophyticus TaxID=1978490 RepID=UPI0020A051E4|nr:1,2-phenylacetyl-CoA epoxidase subunit PaaD [Lysinibacillus endophyticus]MCP1146237.1 phenylacetate-CoA oxygenase subunit PaaJ [Lysinibacillus endophyticus]
MTAVDTKDRIYQVLDTIKDPEIDTVSILDLGMVEQVEIDGQHVTIKMLPTFSGCPALNIIQGNIERAVKTVENVDSVEVQFIFNPPWTSDRITEKGKEGLKQFGIAPPPKYLEEDGSWHVNCPYCNSEYVTMENLFGPTACRSILYCKSCKNPFEAMKPISTLM